MITVWTGKEIMCSKMRRQKRNEEEVDDER